LWKFSNKSASNFVEFFEKMAIAIERLADVILRYWGIERYVDPRKVSKLFKSLPCAIYVYLFEFSRCLVCVFIKDNGSKLLSVLKFLDFGLATSRM
jgi:hypothetical protein